MIVCHCKAVSHREIECALDEGAGCIGTVAARTGAGTDCGGCHRAIVKIIQKREEKPAASGLLAGLFKVPV